MEMDYKRRRVVTTSDIDSDGETTECGSLTEEFEVTGVNTVAEGMAQSAHRPLDVASNEEQVVEISDDEEEDRTAKQSIAERKPASQYKPVRDYRCPICFDPPDTAIMTMCGHVFCCACLFQMVNSSRTHRKNGQCALCRSDVKLRDLRMLILRKKRVKRL